MSGSHFGVKPMCIPAIPPQMPGFHRKDTWGCEPGWSYSEPQEMPSVAVRELDADDGAPWQLGVPQTEPQKI